MPDPVCICEYDDYEPHRRRRNPQCPEHGKRDTEEFLRLSAGGPAPQGYEGWWQCPECNDIYGPEDAEDGDVPPVCAMCLKSPSVRKQAEALERSLLPFLLDEARRRSGE